MKLPYCNKIDIVLYEVEPQKYFTINQVLEIPELNHGLFFYSITEVSQNEFTIQVNSELPMHNLYVNLYQVFEQSTIYFRIEHKDTDMVLIHKYKNKEHTTTAVSYWRQYLINDRTSAIEELTEQAPNMIHDQLKAHPAYMYLTKTEKQTFLSISMPF